MIMFEREVLFCGAGENIPKLIDMVSVYKFGEVLPLTRCDNSSIKFAGVDDYVLHYFSLCDPRLEERLRGHRFSNAYFKGCSLPNHSEIMLSRCLQTVNITPSEQLENVHSKIMEFPELMVTYLWWASYEWMEKRS